MVYKVVPHRDVRKKDEVLLKEAGLFQRYLEIIDVLKQNPFSRVNQWEPLEPRKKKIYSMRINSQHRVVYSIDKKDKMVKIWSAWSHYEHR